MSDHLGFSPDILRRLGEELVPYADQGLVELVRNAYDADATSCTIELINVGDPGGSILITDDGTGMDRSSIANGWLVIGRSSKKRSQRTGSSRIPAGDKGLGRLAGLRLGREAVLRSRPDTEPGTEYAVKLDWDAFDEARVIEDVPVKVEKSKTPLSPGTTIEIRNLRTPFTRTSVSRLARSLVLLSDPFDHADGFRPVLLAPEFADLEARVRESYFDEIQYRIRAELHVDGTATAHVLDVNGKPRFSADHARIAKARNGRTYETPPAVFELWVFNLGATGFATRAATKAELTEWIKVVGGVHVYQHDLRVPPYGDSGEDWLDMNLRRARSPEFRPSTNQSVGRVVIASQDERLLQKTDRTGFVENDAFVDLRNFCRDVLDWSASAHLKVAEEKRRAERKSAEKANKAAASDEAAVRSSITGDPAARAAFDRYQKAIQRQLAALREDVLLYRTLGTVGTTWAAFAHESVKPTSRIEQGVKLARSAGNKRFGGDFDQEVGKPLDAIEKAAAALGKWAQLPLRLLRRDKRRQQRIDLGAALGEVIELLQPFMEDARIQLTLNIVDEDLPVFAPPAALESIAANLLINSIQALVSGPARKRAINLTVMRRDRYAVLIVEDSGSGIEGIDIEDVWLPGRTTREQGTGLGLAIVQDSVSDLGGSVRVDSKSTLGGASFSVELPIVDA